MSAFHVVQIGPLQQPGELLIDCKSNWARTLASCRLAQLLSGGSRDGSDFASALLQRSTRSGRPRPRGRHHHGSPPDRRKRIALPECPAQRSPASGHLAGPQHVDAALYMAPSTAVDTSSTRTSTVSSA